MPTRTLAISPKQSQILYDAFAKFQSASLVANEALAQLTIAKELVADSLHVDPTKLLSINEIANTVKVEVPDVPLVPAAPPANDLLADTIPSVPVDSST